MGASATPVFEHLSLEDQLQTLTKRGMHIQDQERASYYLQHIGYYKLRHYWETFYEKPHEARKFRADANFDAVINTYLFDRELRLLVFDEIERIETSIKAVIASVYCTQYGSHWYEDVNLFINPDIQTETLSSIETELLRSKETFISDHRRDHAPTRPPAWMAFQVTSMGQISKTYSNLREDQFKREVAKVYGLNFPVLTSWLESLTYVRNVCAHHARLWNKRNPIPFKLLKITRRPWIDTTVLSQEDLRKSYYAMAAIKYMLNAFIPETSFATRLATLLRNREGIPLDYMGWPEGWKTEPVWNTNEDAAADTIDLPA